MNRRWSQFLELVALETDECVLWPYARIGKGYGRVREPGAEDVATHRKALELRRGAPPSVGLYAAHSCHTPACINHRHLRWATPAENTKDRIGDGTARRGEQHPAAKLTWADVVAIRASLQLGERNIDVARRFGVGKQIISDIKRGRRWRDAA